MIIMLHSDNNSKSTSEPNTIDQQFSCRCSFQRKTFQFRPKQGAGPTNVSVINYTRFVNSSGFTQFHTTHFLSSCACVRTLRLTAPSSKQFIKQLITGPLSLTNQLHN